MALRGCTVEKLRTWEAQGAVGVSDPMGQSSLERALKETVGIVVPLNKTLRGAEQRAGVISVTAEVKWRVWSDFVKFGI